MSFFLKMASSAGLEPVTYGLTVRRFTDWTMEEVCSPWEQGGNSEKKENCKVKK